MNNQIGRAVFGLSAFLLLVTGCAKRIEIVRNPSGIILKTSAFGIIPAGEYKAEFPDGTKYSLNFKTDFRLVSGNSELAESIIEAYTTRGVK